MVRHLEPPFVGSRLKVHACRAAVCGGPARPCAGFCPAGKGGPMGGRPIAAGPAGDDVFAYALVVLGESKLSVRAAICFILRVVPAKNP